MTPVLYIHIWNKAALWVMLGSCWSYFGFMLGWFWIYFGVIILGVCWGPGVSYGFSGPKRLPRGHRVENQQFFVPFPPPDKLGPLSVQDASKIDVGGVVLVTGFHHAFSLLDNRLKDPFKIGKTRKISRVVTKYKLPTDMMKKNCFGEGFRAPSCVVLGINLKPY